MMRADLALAAHYQTNRDNEVSLMHSARSLGSDGSIGLPAALTAPQMPSVMLCPLPMAMAPGGVCDIYRLAYEMARAARRSPLYEWICAAQVN